LRESIRYLPSGVRPSPSCSLGPVGFLPSETVYLRWLHALGACGALLQEGLRLLQDKDPRLALHRHIYPAAGRKYRTEQRREQLQTARFVPCVAGTFYHTFSAPDRSGLCPPFRPGSRSRPGNGELPTHARIDFEIGRWFGLGGVETRCLIARGWRGGRVTRSSRSSAARSWPPRVVTVTVPLCPRRNRGESKSPAV
jgi:hypothetical protein